MIYDDLTQYEKHRFDDNPRCIYCGEIIKKNSQFRFIKNRFGRYVIYSFIHRGCILKAREWLINHEGGVEIK